jgi:hypothetical protein
MIRANGRVWRTEQVPGSALAQLPNGRRLVSRGLTKQSHTKPPTRPPGTLTALRPQARLLNLLTSRVWFVARDKRICAYYRARVDDWRRALKNID